MNQPILIIGGGLSGLRLASLLAEENIPFKILEARDRLGGRIFTHQNTANNYFDLGPTWYWPATEPTIVNLVNKLSLPVTPQYNEGSSLLELSENTPPKKINASEVNNESMRIIGGVNALVNAVKQNVPEDAIHLNTQVTSVTHEDNHNVLIHAHHTKTGEEMAFQAEQIVLTLPPRLLLEHVNFTPPLPENIHMDLLNKPTWMGAQAKMVVTYETPFWRRDGLSGNAVSWVGPLREIYDASTEAGDSALFGFFSLAPLVRAAYSKDEIQNFVIEQLSRLFGQQAENYKNIIYNDWSTDPHMTTEGDKLNIESFPAYGQPPVYYKNIKFAGTEYDDKNGGHLEGALRSAEHVFDEIKNSL
jgi:monoamine oxidase